MDITIGYNMDACICLLRNNILAVTNHDTVLTFNTNNYLSDRDKLTQLQRTGKSSLLNDRDPDADDNAMSATQWSSSLMALAWDEPFILGCVSNGIEIRHLESYGSSKQVLLQTLAELNRIKFLVRAKSGVIFAAGSTEIWCLRRVPIALQRQKLLDNKLFQVAIDLTVSVTFLGGKSSNININWPSVRV